MRMLFSAAAALAVIATTASAQTAGKYQPLHDTVAKAVAAKDVPGAIVAMRVNGKLVYQDAQGEDAGAPLKTDTVFWVASMTKPVVATSVMIMVDEGKVKLDDPLSKYIPEFSKPRQVRSLPAGASLPPPAPPGTTALPIKWEYAPAKRALTVRDMITMTGGLQTIRVPSAFPPASGKETLETFVARLGEVPLDFQPGSRWAYSNATSFDVAARVVEVASGMNYRAFVQQRIFDPLGMKDSHFGIREDLKPRMLPLAPNMANSPIAGGAYVSGSAGLFTTVDDYSKFAQMLLDDGRAPNGKRVLSAKSAQAMHTNQIGDLSLAGISAGSYGGLPEKTNPAIKYGYGLNLIVDPAGAKTDVPKNSYGWDGVGTRRFWVMPQYKTVLVMLVPGGKADDLHRALETAAVPLVK
jgi:CubicO group peptidase (beta-lactamase class C family)